MDDWAWARGSILLSERRIEWNKADVARFLIGAAVMQELRGYDTLS